MSTQAVPLPGVVEDLNWGRSAMTPWRLRRVTELIEIRLGGRVTLEEMARQAGMSPFHFCRQFKRATGLTPHQFVLHKRVERAKQRLAARDETTLAEMSDELGFVSQSHFTTVFRKLAGSTPRAYRERVRSVAL